jgi:hypothetical protein
MVKRFSKIGKPGEPKRPIDAGRPVTPPSALTNTVPPFITGRFSVDQEVAANVGIWNSLPDSYQFQWLRDGSAISGATAVTYTLTLDDVGDDRLSVRVTAFKTGYYSGVATSGLYDVSEQVALIDLEELALAEDTPTISYQTMGGSSSPSFGSGITSAGWYREKRVGVAQVAPGGSQSSTADLDIDGSTYFRYPGVIEVDNWAGGSTTGRYVETPLKTGGGVQSARWLMGIEFEIENTDRVQIALNAVVSNGRLGTLLVNGRRVSASDLATVSTAGSGYAVTLVFPSVGTRRIKIYGLNHNQGRFGGVAVPTGGIVREPADPLTRRIVFLGDSLVNGSTGVSALQTFVWDIGRAMKADDIVQLGIGGTGFTNNGGDAEGLYIDRVPDILALNPDALVIVGGRNDGSAAGLGAAVTAVLDATESIGERWLLSENVSSTGNTAMQSAANAAGVEFVDLSDYDDLVPLSDGVHPTLTGHRELAVIAIERMGLDTTPDPGDPDVLTPATGTPSTGLPWELPTAAQVASGPTPERQMFAHYYGPQPAAFSNTATDYYESNYLPVNGEGGIHAAYGGYLRDRPGTIVRAPYATTPVSWQRNMQNKEIAAMIQAGVTGAFCNIMGSSGDNWNRYMWLLDEAVANFPGFKVVPMLDANGGTVQNDSVATAAARVNTFLSTTAAWQYGGKYVVATFKMEGATSRAAGSPTGLAYWQAVKDALLTTHGKDTTWIGVYNNPNVSNQYDSIQFMSGRWGPGSDPNIVNNLTDEGVGVKARGKKFLFPTWSQDIRYRSSIWDEARNTECVRAYGDTLIRQNADFSQMCTWSDMSEATHFRPSVGRGQTFADVHTYRLTKWRAGKFPQILRDAIYLTHRNQMLNATVTGGQNPMTQWQRGSNMSAPREKVEVLTYLTAPADITLKVGATTYTYTAPAGEYAYLANQEAGEVSVKAVRSAVEIARINSPVVVRTTVVNQDRQYFGFSSLRGTTGQYDPTPGAPTPNAANYLP